MEYFASFDHSFSRTAREPILELAEKPWFAKTIVLLCFLGITLLSQKLFIPEKLEVFPPSYDALIPILLLSVVLLSMKRKNLTWILLLSLLCLSYGVYYNLPIFYLRPIQAIYCFNIFFLMLIYIRFKELYFIRFISILLIGVNLLKTSELFENVAFALILLMMTLIFADFFGRNGGSNLDKSR